jgi:mycothiol synthase
VLIVDKVKTIEERYQVRPASLEDVEALTDLFNQYWETLTGVVKFTYDEIKTLFSTPGLDIEDSIRVVLTPEGEFIAAVLVLDLGNPPIHPNVYGCVDAAFEGQGIGTYLLQWAEERAKKAIPRCPEGSRVSMYVQTTQSHEPTMRLFDKLGLNVVRYSWLMVRGLDDEIPEPEWPEGISIQTYQDFDDLETILRAVDDAFQDHWGYVDRSGDPERINRFRYSIENDKDFDPALWYLAMDGDEIAGMSLCNPKFGTDRETGFVETLGVLRPWRRQGLVLALLHYTFAEFKQRDYKQVGLGVDTQNLSGATRLYEKAGMQVAKELAVYEKELRPGDEMAKQE